MSRKEDMQAALEGRQPAGAVPIWELEFHLWDQASSEKFFIGNEFSRLSTSERESALHTNAKIMIATARELGFAALTVPGSYWEVAPSIPAYYWLPEEDCFRQVEALNKVGVEDIMLVANVGGVIHMPSSENYVEFAYQLFDDPESIDQLAREHLQEGLALAKRFRDLGVEAMFTASDIADNHGPFFNLTQMQRFVLPYLNTWAERIKELGCYAILHTDGNILPFLEMLADSGIHALQAIDPVAGMDIREVKKRIGHQLCICGNLDCGLLLTGSAQRIYEETRDLLLDCKAGGGFVLGASNAVQQETPLGNYRAMIDAWRAHGKY